MYVISVITYLLSLEEKNKIMQIIGCMVQLIMHTYQQEPVSGT